MQVFLLIFSSFLAVTNGRNYFNTYSQEALASLTGLDDGMKQGTEFWKSWFEEFSTLNIENDVTKCTKEGHFPHSGTCNKFYRCVTESEGENYKRYDYVCAPNTVFDVNLGKCHHLRNATTLSGCHHHDTMPEFNPDTNSDFGLETKYYCIYDLHMSYIYGSPDGVLKRIIGFNGQFPGPTIRCTRGKWMVVRVTNSIADNNEPTSIHWHGIEQNLSPFYDGPESVTQCPIIRDTSMIYKFQLFQSGTYWYHSHHSYQYVDGAWGFLIVRNTPREVWQSAYDEETLISFNDWIHRRASDISHTYLTTDHFPITNATLINGQGRFNCSLKDPGQICKTSLMAPAVVNVIRGKRYRIRILNASGANTYNFSIDSHKLIAIETDGVDTFQSPKFDIVNIQPAQRYSLLVKMDQPLNEYWIRVSTGTLPEENGLAILRYVHRPVTLASTGATTGGITIEAEDVSITTVPDFGTVQGRPHFQDIPWQNIVSGGGIRPSSPPELKAFFPLHPPSIVSRQDQIQQERIAEVSKGGFPTTLSPSNPIVLNDEDCPPYDINGNGGAPNYFDQLVTVDVTACGTVAEPALKCMNGEPFVPGAINTLPVLFELINGDAIADTNRPVYTPTLGKVIRIVVNNYLPFPHPWHLHGHTFWVLGNGAIGDGVYNATNDSSKLNVNGVRRDTSFTRGTSWAVYTYITDNPGTWFFHCHINWHLQAGLGMVMIEARSVAQKVYAAPPLQSYLTCKRVGVNID